MLASRKEDKDFFPFQKRGHFGDGKQNIYWTGLRN